jgi:hypothetical protein
MTERPFRDDLELPSEAVRAQATVRDLPDVPADPSFRERLKSDFTSGSLVATPAARARRSARLAWRASYALAAAAALAFIVGLGNRGAAWTVSGSSLGATAIGGSRGDLLVDGKAISSTEPAVWSQALRRGHHIEWRGEGDLELVSRGALAMQILPGTVLDLPAPPGRWFGRSVKGRIESGEVRITTGQRFEGARLTLFSPEARVEVTGTTLAVIREPFGTCVCVYEGSVRVALPGEAPLAIEGGSRRVVFNDGRTPIVDAMRPAEQKMLGILSERRAEIMETDRD